MISTHGVYEQLNRTFFHPFVSWCNPLSHGGRNRSVHRNFIISVIARSLQRCCRNVTRNHGLGESTAPKLFALKRWVEVRGVCATIHTIGFVAGGAFCQTVRSQIPGRLCFLCLQNRSAFIAPRVSDKKSMNMSIDDTKDFRWCWF